MINLVRSSSVIATSLAKNGSKVLLSFFSIFHNEPAVIKLFNDLIMRIC